MVQVETSKRRLLTTESSQDIEIGTIETGVETVATTTFHFEEHQEEIDLKDAIRIIETRLGVDIKIGTTTKMYFKSSSVSEI